VQIWAWVVAYQQNLRRSKKVTLLLTWVRVLVTMLL
jgi:hypothetical protein